MSRLMTLMTRGNTAAENLRNVASPDLDHLAKHGASDQLRADTAELAVLARAAADRAESDPTGWGRPERGTPLAKLQAAVLYATVTAEEAWWDNRTGTASAARAEARVRSHLDKARAALQEASHR